MVRGFVRRALAKAFPEVVIREAEDGKAAMTEMSQKKVDLIITDLEMPGMDGRTFLRKMRSNALLKTKPVMVLSGNITPDLLREFMEDPYIWFLEKPATPEEIVEIAGRLIRV
jgi:CheY-like chemotaxis protein